MISPLKLKIQKSIDQHARSEITLYNLHQSMLDKEDVDIDAILKSYNDEDRKHLIVDRSKGKIFDSRLENIDNLMNYSVRILNMTTKLENNEPEIDMASSLKSNASNNLTASGFNKEKPRHKSKSVWENNWKQVEKVHQKFLQAICRNNSTNFFAYLDKKQNQTPIDINYKFQSNWSPIHYSAMHSTILILSRLINHPSIDINSLTDFGETPLHIAVKVNKYQNCQLLINAGVCIDYKDKDQYTALHYAAELGYGKIIELLIANHASTEIKNNNGLTAAQLCTLTDLVKLFPKTINVEEKEEIQQNYLFKHRSNHKNMIQKMLLNVNKNENCPQKVNLSLTESKKQQLKGRKKNILKLYELIKEQNQQPITLSSFQFFKKIGEGAFGQVYIVKKLKSDRLYALKAIKKQRVFGTSLYRYIQTQKEILSLINHPFIVRLHFAFQTEAYLFLVMDYCQGGDLSKLLQKKKRFEQKVVKAYAAQILLGIQALHQNKIIYRDLKPQNIVIDRDGHALITDFGLSKKTQSLDDINKSFCGTPAYLPLQIINKKGHNRMVDWYEFGIVLYELITGFPPFYAETKAELYDVVRQGVIRFPKNTPQLFRDLIKKLLAQNPEKRLGFVDDAESIKEHPWFADVDWDAVLDRKQVMPPVENKVKLGDPIRTKFHDIKSDKFQIPSWSFIA